MFWDGCSAQNFKTIHVTFQEVSGVRAAVYNCQTVLSVSRDVAAASRMEIVDGRFLCVCGKKEFKSLDVLFPLGTVSVLLLSSGHPARRIAVC